jgi:radical SAM superfamily enzyme YgiQ (UPF0313 family)
MKIVLVTHPFTQKGRPLPYIPIGLLSLGTVLKNNGFDVEIYDVNKHTTLEEHIQQSALEISSRSPDFIGFTSICNFYPMTIQLAQRTALYTGNAKILLGGPQAALTAEETLKAFPWIDLVVRCEAEQTITPILNALGQNEPLRSIPGVSYRERGQIVSTANPTPIDLDDLPLIDYRLFKCLEKHEIIPVEVGRGCPFNCTFCSTSPYWFKRFRIFNQERVLAQIKELYEQGYRKFGLLHDIFTLDRNWVEHFCRQLIERDMRILWRCSSRLDCLDEELISLMRQSGCQSIYLGIETGSKRLQKIIHKDLDLDRVFPTVSALKKAEIATTVSFITGFPEERKEDVQETFRALLGLICTDRNANHFQLHLLEPVCGSTLLSRHRDRLRFFGIEVAKSFGAALDDESRQMVQSHPDVFVSFYGYEHPVFERSFLCRFVLFSNIINQFPFTCFVFWKWLEPDLTEIIFIHPEVLEPMDRIENIEDTSGLIKAVSEVFTRIQRLVAKDSEWLKDLVGYEQAICQAIIEERDKENPLVLNLTSDIDVFIKGIWTGKEDEWIIPSPPLPELISMVFWNEEKNLKITKVSGKLAPLLHSFSISNN